MQITVDSATGAADALRDLDHALAAEPQLRGRFRPAPAGAAPPGSLGQVTDLLVAGGADVAAGVLAAVLVDWLRRQPHDLTVRVRRPDGTVVEATVPQVRHATAAQRRDLVRALRRALESDDGDAAG